jgi:hypothetical protein
MDNKEGGGVMRLKLFFRWYDLWVGAYVDMKGQAVYICPVPMLGVKITWGAAAMELDVDAIRKVLYTKLAGDYWVSAIDEKARTVKLPPAEFKRVCGYFDLKPLPAAIAIEAYGWRWVRVE